MQCFATEPTHRPSMRILRNRLRVLNARVNGGSSMGVALSNMFSCGFGRGLNNDLRQFSTYSRNKDTTKPRASVQSTAQQQQYSVQAAPPRQQQQIMQGVTQMMGQQPSVQGPPMQQYHVQQNQVMFAGTLAVRSPHSDRSRLRQVPPPGMFGQPQQMMVQQQPMGEILILDCFRHRSSLARMLGCPCTSLPQSCSTFCSCRGRSPPSEGASLARAQWCMR